MNYTALSISVLAFLVPVLSGAGSRSDFSGTWKMDVTRSESAHSGADTEPVTIIMKQTANELSVETQRGSQSETIVYKLDGTESTKPAEDNGPFSWRAKWDGAKLVTETHRNVNRATVTITEVLSLDSKAKEMTVDRTLMVQHGYTMRGTKNYSSGKDLFVKAR